LVGEADMSRPAEVVIPRSNTGDERTPLCLAKSQDGTVLDLGVADGEPALDRGYFYTRTGVASRATSPAEADRAVVHYSSLR
jgi:hypothetical protein